MAYSETIYVETWGWLNYTLSNSPGDIENAVYLCEGVDIDLDELDWFPNYFLASTVKEVMNRLNVNFSYPEGLGIVNMRYGNTWYSANF